MKIVDEYGTTGRSGTYAANFTTDALSNTGSALNPGASALIMSLSLPPGKYQVTVTVYLSGTVAAGDANNVQLFWNPTGYKVLYPAVANVPESTTFTATINGGSIGAFTIGASSGGGVTYNVGISAVAIAASPTGAAVVNAVEALPNYEIPEMISSVLVTGPTLTPFNLNIGNRSWDLVTDNTGKAILSPIALLLTRNDRRLLSSPVSGNWTLELMGTADARF